MSTPVIDSGWYYALRGGPAGGQVGPVGWEDLVAHARGGAFGPQDLVWNEQLDDWRPASQVPGLFPSPAAAPLGSPAAAAYAAPRPAKSKLLYWLIPLIVVILAGAGLGAYFGFFYHKGAALAQKEGEILLEAAGVAGPDSFAGEQFVIPGPTTTLSIPNPKVTLPQVALPLAATTTSRPATGGSVTTSPAASTTTAGTVKQATMIVAYPGDTPALYGGSKSKVIADKEAELAFLEKNPKKAAAFCEALDSDPTLRWSGGNKVTPSQLRAYFAELTPMLLTRDTRVTNYGYKNGRPTPRQSVLQAGQLVLVDQYGVPRKRCECGNPLTPPRPAKKAPVYKGPRWPGFDPTTIIVIQSTTIVIDIFVVIDVETGDTYVRPPGTEGGSDGAPPASPGETTVTTAPPAAETSSTETTAPAVVTTGPPTSEDISYVGGFEGTWDTNWGVLTFTRDGVALHAEYEHDAGRIDATLGADGMTMEGTWAESPSYSPPDDGGRVTFTLSADGNSINGQWWYGNDTSGGDWVGTRIQSSPGE